MTIGAWKERRSVTLASTKNVPVPVASSPLNPSTNPLMAKQGVSTSESSHETQLSPGWADPLTPKSWPSAQSCALPATSVTTRSIRMTSRSLLCQLILPRLGASLLWKWMILLRVWETTHRDWFWFCQVLFWSGRQLYCVTGLLMNPVVYCCFELLSCVYCRDYFLTCIFERVYFW